MADAERVSGPGALLRDFVNTLDVEAGGEMLDSPAALTGWLRDRGLLGAAGRANAADLEAALAIREGLRAAMAAHHDLSPHDRNAPQPALDAAIADLRLRVTFQTGHPALEPVDMGVRAALARIASAIVASASDGTWARLKVCAEDTCLWAFVDSSKNRSRSWCAMSVCGNRRKTRTYRARRRGVPDDGASS